MLVRRSFSLDTDRDAALIAWLDAQENLSEAVRTALRAYCDIPHVTLTDVYRAVLAIEQRLATGVTLSTSATALTEDPDLAANLDSLGL